MFGYLLWARGNKSEYQMPPVTFTTRKLKIQQKVGIPCVHPINAGGGSSVRKILCETLSVQRLIRHQTLRSLSSGSNAIISISWDQRKNIPNRYKETKIPNPAQGGRERPPVKRGLLARDLRRVESPTAKLSVTWEKKETRQILGTRLGPGLCRTDPEGRDGLAPLIFFSPCR